MTSHNPRKSLLCLRELTICMCRHHAMCTCMRLCWAFSLLQSRFYLGRCWVLILTMGQVDGNLLPFDSVSVLGALGLWFWCQHHFIIQVCSHLRPWLLINRHACCCIEWFEFRMYLLLFRITLSTVPSEFFVYLCIKLLWLYWSKWIQLNSLYTK